MTSDPASEAIGVELFGGFALSAVDGRPIALNGRRVRGILAYLLLAPRQTATREKLCGLFWGDRSEPQARSSLRQCLLELRAALGEAADRVLVANRTSVSLIPGAVACDAIRFASMNGEADGKAVMALVEGLGSGDLLDDLELGGLFGEWRDQERARLGRTLAGVIAGQLARLETAGDWPRLIALGEAWLRRDPLDETTVAAVLRAERVSGAAAAAQRRYDAFRKLLAAELGIAPGGGVEDALRASDGTGQAPPAAAGQTLPAAPEPLLAVLAFDNLSPDPEMDFFSEGVAEEILQNLARSTSIRVIARSSSFCFRGREKVTAVISSRLGATHLLDGAVRRQGEHLRISAALVECATQVTLWSGQFNRDLSDVFALQDEIAAAVSSGLERVFTAKPAARNIAPDVYDRFLRARSIAGSPADVAQCIALLDGVVAAVPGFAPAWASLAMARAIVARWTAGTDRFEASRGAALEAAERAVALDPEAGLPLVALSLLEAEHAYAVREGLLRRALAASPNDAEVLKHAADFAGSVGRTTECRELTLRAAALDPINALLACNAAIALADTGEIDAAFGEFDGIVARWPDLPWARSGPLLIAALRRDWDRVERFIDPRAAVNEYYRRAMTTAEVMRQPLDQACARLLTAAERQLAETGRSELGVLITLGALGRLDDAFDLVRRSNYTSQRGMMPGGLLLTSIVFGAANEAMRAEPRFLDLCARLGLCQYWTATGKWPDCADAALSYDFRAEAARALADASRLEMQT